MPSPAFWPPHLAMMAVTVGITTSLTNELTIFPNAAPMMIPMAMSTMFPLKANALNSSMSEAALFLIPISFSLLGCLTFK